MKKNADFKYPHSARLFQFCRLVLDHKLDGARIIDQDIGQILGFDPADCSHWKKGKKNIRSIYAIKSISDHLQVDERLILEIAAGELDENEAFLEYSGYGLFQMSANALDTIKKAYYKQNASDWSKDRDLEFRKFFEPDIKLIDITVSSIHEKIHFEESPLYIPEIAAAYSGIKLIGVEKAELPENTAVISDLKEKVCQIRYESGKEIRPFMRFLIARELGAYFLQEHKRDNVHLKDYAHDMQQIEYNLFAAKLLTPAPLVKKEMARVNDVKDIVSQLSDIFWVSKSFMNRRLKYILEHNPNI